MIIYKTTNTINNKIYIGQDKNNDPTYLGSGNLIKKAIKKYGKEKFIKEILYICNTIEELNEKERFYINEYNSINKEIGYNISIGGTNGVMLNRKHSNETKEKMSKSALGKIKSEIHRKNIGLSTKGRIISDEEKKKRSLSNPYTGMKKTPLSNEIKQKISNTKKGKCHSIKTKEKMSKSHMGTKNSFYGKKHSEEYLLRRRKPIIQLDKDNNFIKEWLSISEASEQLKISNSGISFVLNGKYKTSGGFKFKYKNNE
jgi:group I intron endonuclease